MEYDVPSHSLTIAPESFLQPKELPERRILSQHSQTLSLSHSIAAFPRRARRRTRQADLRQQAFDLSQALAYLGCVDRGDVVEREREERLHGGRGSSLPGWEIRKKKMGICRTLSAEDGYLVNVGVVAARRLGTCG